MSDTMVNQGAICPGQRSLLNPDLGSDYLRVMFSVEWIGAMPSAEEFFLHKHRIVFNPSGKTALENHVAGLLKVHARDAVYRVKYLCYAGFQMTDDEVIEAGWRFIAGDSYP